MLGEGGAEGDDVGAAVGGVVDEFVCVQTESGVPPDGDGQTGRRVGHRGVLVRRVEDDFGDVLGEA